MKKIMMAVFLFSASSHAYADQFCDGFKEGYKSGYKQAKNSGLDPLTPICPLKPLKGLSDPKSDYEFGYTVGYRKGAEDGGN